MKKVSNEIVEREEVTVEENPMQKGRAVEPRLLNKFILNRDKVVEAEVIVGRASIQISQFEKTKAEATKDYFDGQKGLKAAYEQMQNEYGPGQLDLDNGLWVSPKNG